MPPTAQEAYREQVEAANDVREDGAPVLVRFDRNHSSGPGRQRPPADWVDVETYALFDRSSAGTVGADQDVLIGDLELWVAEHGLRSLAGLPEVPRSGPSGSGYVVLMMDGNDGFPQPGGEGVRELRILRCLETVRTGSYPVIHRLQARG